MLSIKSIKKPQIIKYACTLLAFSVLLSTNIYSQSEEDLYPTTRKIILPLSDSTIEFEVEIVETTLEELDNNATYHWFSPNKIHTSVGGFEGQLLDGSYVVKMANGELGKKGFFDQGLKSGSWKVWYKNGQLKSMIEWDKGLKNGAFKLWDEKGTLMKQYSFEDNLKDGKYSIFHSSGRLAEKGKMKEGKKHGVIRSYYKDGELESKIRFRHGEKDGWSKVYDQEGQLKYKQKYRDGELIPKMEKNDEDEENIKKWQFWKNLGNSDNEEEGKNQE